MAGKSRFGPELTEAEIHALVYNVVDPGVFNNTIILLGLAGYEMIITNLALRASLVITTSNLARPRRIIVN